MLEAIRTFFGKVRGSHGERRTVVQETLYGGAVTVTLYF
jgi:hypothetical protein